MRNKSRLICLSAILCGLFFVTAAVADVTCENPAGKCSVGDSMGECVCWDGEGAAWADGSSDGTPPPSLTEEELKQKCVENLEGLCGTEIPNIEDYCDETELVICSEALDKILDFEENCEFEDDDDDDGDSDSDSDSGDSSSTLPPPPEVDNEDLADIIGCCEELAEPETEDFIECLMALEDDDCDGFFECDESWYDEAGEDEKQTGGSDLSDDDSNEDESGAAGGSADNADGANGDSESNSGTSSDDAAGTGCNVVVSATSSAPLQLLISIALNLI